MVLPAEVQRDLPRAHGSDTSIQHALGSSGFVNEGAWRSSMEEQSQGQQHHPTSQLQARKHGEFPNFFQIKSFCGLSHKHCQGKSCIALFAEMVNFRRKKGLGMPLNCLYLWVVTNKGKPTFQIQLSPCEWLQLPAAPTPKSGRASQRKGRLSVTAQDLTHWQEMSLCA